MSSKLIERENNVSDLQENVAREPETQSRIGRFNWGYRGSGLLALLVFVMIAQMWTSIRQLSVTSDEVDHLHAGYRYLQCNDFGWNPEHPPLAKMVAALPLMAMQVKDPVPNACGLANDKELDFRIGHSFLVANPESMLMAARMATSSFTILLLVGTWMFAQTLFGMPVALIAGTLITFEPNLLGHGSLVTTDVPAALGFLIAIYALWKYLAAPGFGRILALGLAIGIALTLKYSTLILIGILPILILTDVLVSHDDGRARRFLRSMGALFLALVIAITVLWAIYGFRYAARPNAARPWMNARVIDSRSALATKAIPAIEKMHLLPQAYLIGVQDVLVESEQGRPAYLLGRNYLGGRWYYFPAAASIKFTVPLLLIIIFSLAMFHFWRKHIREFLFLLLPVILFFWVSAGSGMNIGVRHVFPIIPLLAIFGAAGVWNAPWNRRSVIAAVIVVLFGHVATSLHAYPNYISYGNELWGGPANVYKHLADSNVDWGQAQKMARSYIERTRPSSCFEIRPYNNLNSDYSIPCGDISELGHDIPPVPFTGTLVVSSNVVDGVVKDLGLASARVFRNLKPKAILGGSALLVYEGTFDLTPIIAAQHVKRIGTDVHTPPEVLEEALTAIKLDPSNMLAHLRACQAYAYMGQAENAQVECDKLYELKKNDLYTSEADRKAVVRMMIQSGMAAPPGSMSDSTF